MNTNSRSSHEHPVPLPRPEAVVALIGFRRPLGANATGLFERCQLRALEFPDLVDACRYLETIVPDAVVLDTHHPELKAHVELVRRLLRAISVAEQRGRRVPLVVLHSMGVRKDVRASFFDAGAYLVPSDRQGFRHVVRLTRRLCGMGNQCCNVGRSRQLVV